MKQPKESDCNNVVISTASYVEIRRLGSNNTFHANPDDNVRGGRGQ